MRKPGERFKERLKALNRRVDFLEERIANYKGKDDSRDRAEAAAIRWAINVIETYPEEAMIVVRSRG